MQGKTRPRRSGQELCHQPTSPSVCLFFPLSALPPSIPPSVRPSGLADEKNNVLWSSLSSRRSLTHVQSPVMERPAHKSLFSPTQNTAPGILLNPPTTRPGMEGSIRVSCQGKRWLAKWSHQPTLHRGWKDWITFQYFLIVLCTAYGFSTCEDKATWTASLYYYLTQKSFILIQEWHTSSEMLCFGMAVPLKTHGSIRFCRAWQTSYLENPHMKPWWSSS